MRLPEHLQLLFSSVLLFIYFVHIYSLFITSEGFYLFSLIASQKIVFHLFWALKCLIIPFVLFFFKECLPQRDVLYVIVKVLHVVFQPQKHAFVLHYPWDLHSQWKI